MEDGLKEKGWVEVENPKIFTEEELNNTKVVILKNGEVETVGTVESLTKQMKKPNVCKIGHDETTRGPNSLYCKACPRHQHREWRRIARERKVRNDQTRRS